MVQRKKIKRNARQKGSEIELEAGLQFVSSRKFQLFEASHISDLDQSAGCFFILHYLIGNGRMTEKLEEFISFLACIDIWRQDYYRQFISFLLCIGRTNFCPF